MFYVWETFSDRFYVKSYNMKIGQYRTLTEARLQLLATQRKQGSFNSHFITRQDSNNSERVTFDELTPDEEFAICALSTDCDCIKTTEQGISCHHDLEIAADLAREGILEEVLAGH